MWYTFQVSVFRIDTATLGAPEQDSDGVLHVEAYATRSGVFTYATGDGKTHREYRPESEVFSPDSLRTVSGAPVTIGHPGLVNVQNIRSVRVGVIEGDPRQEGALMAIRLRLDEPSTIEKVLRGELCELSLGYRCDVDPTPGVSPNGERYDSKQENMKVNHVALLPKGKARAGEACAIRLDAADAEEVKGSDKDKDADKSDAQAEKKADDSDSPSEPAADESAAAADEPNEEAQAAAADAAAEANLMTTISELRDRVMALESLLAQAIGRADSMDRRVLELDVTAAMPELRMDGVDSKELRQTVVKKYLPTVRLDGTSDDYSRAMFDAAVSIARSAPVKQVAGVGGVAPNPAQARAEMIARNKSACKV